MKKLLILAPTFAVCALVVTSCKSHSTSDSTREEVVVTKPSTSPVPSTPPPSGTPR